MYLLLHLAGFSYWVSTFLGNSVGAVVSYFLNRSFTFRSQSSGFKSMLRFVAVILFCYFVSYTFGRNLVEWIVSSSHVTPSIKTDIAVLISTGFYTLLNYLSKNYLCLIQVIMKKECDDMSILVLGGAGYIGSHAVYQLIDKGYNVVVVDNLQTGHQEAIHPKATFYQGDIRNKAFLQSVFQKEEIGAVIHFAANSLVGESMEKPLDYFSNNVYGTQIVLEVMKEHHVQNIVFSSSAAVYGEQEVMPITEEMTDKSNQYIW